jgi:hypothetical protein
MKSRSIACLPAILMTFIFAIGVGQARPADADLVAWLSGNGNANDSSGNGHHGTLVNGTAFTSGRAGQAFSFDGINDHITVSPSTALEPVNMSIAMWVRATPGTGGQLQLLGDSSHASVANSGWALQILSNNHVGFAYGNGLGFPQVNSTSVVADNTFHHIAATFDGNFLRMYFDGMLQSTVAYSGTRSVTGNSIFFGRHVSLNRQLNGALDEIRIYNHALSQGEVTALSAIPEPTSLFLLLPATAALFTKRQSRNRHLSRRTA